ncbi:MAG: cutinase, partial [Mycobacterium sp.]|nr:cutinase [Mycobacterium sp.]
MTRQNPTPRRRTVRAAPPKSRRRRHRILALIAAGAVAVVVGLVVAIIVIVVRRPGPPPSATPPSAIPPTSVPGKAPRPAFQDAGCPDVQMIAIPGTWESSPTDDPFNPGQFPIALLLNVTRPLQQQFNPGRVQVYTVPYT